MIWRSPTSFMSEPVPAKAGSHAFSWRRLCELRRQQIEACAKAEGWLPALFELKTDCRPRAERTADGRYRQLSLRPSATTTPPRSQCCGADQVCTISPRCGAHFGERADLLPYRERRDAEAQLHGHERRHGKSRPLPQRRARKKEMIPSFDCKERRASKHLLIKSAQPNPLNRGFKEKRAPQGGPRRSLESEGGIGLSFLLSRSI